MVRKLLIVLFIIWLRGHEINLTYYIWLIYSNPTTNGFTELPQSARTRLSAGMILIGYSVAFLFPLLGGRLANRTGSVEPALVPSLIFLIRALAFLSRKFCYPNYE